VGPAEVPVVCSACKWTGTVGDCEPDEDGSLCCPECGEKVEVED
jgi:hypothetical protein